VCLTSHLLLSVQSCSGFGVAKERNHAIALLAVYKIGRSCPGADKIVEILKLLVQKKLTPLLDKRVLDDEVPIPEIQEDGHSVPVHTARIAVVCNVGKWPLRRQKVFRCPAWLLSLQVFLLTGLEMRKRFYVICGKSCASTAVIITSQELKSRSNLYKVHSEIVRLAFHHLSDSYLQ